MEGVIRHALDKEKNGYSALYQTLQTQELDKLFGLTGEPVDEDGIRKLQSPSLWIGRTEQEIVMPYFSFVAGKFGNFVGFPLDEVEQTTRGIISRRYLIDSVREGYLEQFEHEGVAVVSPTTKYKPFGF
jgi:predicted acyltransferase